MPLLPAGYEFYGGVQPMRLTDANGVPWQSCCAWNAARVFGFRIFKGNPPVEVPLDPFCKGGGTMNLAGWWNAANDKDCLNGIIPGFAPVLSGHDARVDALISQIAAMNQTIIMLENALGNLGSDTSVLSADDRIALDRLEVFIGL